jgi:hypothetical protein
MSTVSYAHHERVQIGTLAAAGAVFGFAALASFQLALAVGAPLGHAAWGGDSADLTSAQRFGSAVSVVIYAAAAVILLARIGLTTGPRTLWLLKWARGSSPRCSRSARSRTSRRRATGRTTSSALSD